MRLALTKDGQGRGLPVREDAVNSLVGFLQACAAAETLLGALGQCELLGRYGGDDFVLAGFGRRSSASRLLDRAASAALDRVGLDFSSGIASCPANGEEMEDFLPEADQMLGRSKRTSHESRTLPQLARSAESRGHAR